jgi:uncharacterized protein (TIGR03086 family)
MNPDRGRRLDWCDDRTPDEGKRMSASKIDFKPVTDQVAGLLDVIGDDRLSAATPCEEFSVAQLLNHFLGLALAFEASARKDFGPFTGGPPVLPSPEIDSEWRTLLPARLDALAEAWSDPESWDGDTRAGGVTLPAEIMGLVALNEVAVHGWDLARATGQDYELPSGIVEVLLEFDGQDADDQAAREGIYAPVVEVADASPQEQLIAITGRDPHWRP